MFQLAQIAKYSLACIVTNHRKYVTVPPFRSSVFKSVKHFDHSFAFDAPKIWNELPHDVHCAASVASFRKKLKTYLFTKAYPP